MAFHNFHVAQIYNRSTNQNVKGYLQNIAMTPIKFRFKKTSDNQLHPHDEVHTDVMRYKVLTVKPYSASTDEAILVNPNLI